jgi:hypothetical protein
MTSRQPVWAGSLHPRIVRIAPSLSCLMARFDRGFSNTENSYKNFLPTSPLDCQNIENSFSVRGESVTIPWTIESNNAHHITFLAKRKPCTSKHNSVSYKALQATHKQRSLFDTTTRVRTCESHTVPLLLCYSLRQPQYHYSVVMPSPFRTLFFRPLKTELFRLEQKPVTLALLF